MRTELTSRTRFIRAIAGTRGRRRRVRGERPKVSKSSRAPKFCQVMCTAAAKYKCAKFEIHAGRGAAINYALRSYNSTEPFLKQMDVVFRCIWYTLLCTFQLMRARSEYTGRGEGDHTMGRKSV